MENPRTPNEDSHNSASLGDLLTSSDAIPEPFEVMEDTPNEEKSKRKPKRKFYLPNLGLWAGVAGVAAVTTLVVAGVVLLVVTPHIFAATATPPYPTSTPIYDRLTWDWSLPLYTVDTVGSIPVNSFVYIQDMNYDYSMNDWHYTVHTADGQGQGEAWTWQIVPPPPPPQPTATNFPFSDAIGMGYLLITTESVGVIPANSRVRINYPILDNDGWLYSIVAEDTEATATAHYWQLTYAPDVTPGMTPTSPFNGIIGIQQYGIVTKVQIGDIPPGALVSVGSGQFNGHEWSYSIISRDGVAADNALQSQLAPASPAPLDVPIPSSTPTDLPTAGATPVELLPSSQEPGPTLTPTPTALP